MPSILRNLKAPEGFELSLNGIIFFITDAYKIILLFGFLGLLGAIAYLVGTPNIYEAQAQIQMAQISIANDGNGNGNGNGRLDLFGANVEEPALLISRLRSPTSYSDQVIKNCGHGEQVIDSASLARSINVVPIKSVTNVVELKVRGASQGEAIACASALFEFIKTSQAQILAPYIDEAKAKLNDDERRLLIARNTLTEADKSERMTAANYLLMRDEIQHLLIEIASLRKTIIGGDYRHTRLVVPIYAGKTPISPNKRLVLAVWTLGGFLFGILIAIARRSIAKNEIEDTI